MTTSTTRAGGGRKGKRARGAPALEARDRYAARRSDAAAPRRGCKVGDVVKRQARKGWSTQHRRQDNGTQTTTYRRGDCPSLQRRCATESKAFASLSDSWAAPSRLSTKPMRSKPLMLTAQLPLVTQQQNNASDRANSLLSRTRSLTLSPFQSSVLRGRRRLGYHHQSLSWTSIGATALDGTHNRAQHNGERSAEGRWSRSDCRNQYQSLPQRSQTCRVRTLTSATLPSTHFFEQDQTCGSRAA